MCPRTQKLIRPHVAIADHHAGGLIQVQDAVEHLEFVAVGVDLVDRRVVGQDAGRVERGHIEERYRGH